MARVSGFLIRVLVLVLGLGIGIWVVLDVLANLRDRRVCFVNAITGGTSFWGSWGLSGLLLMVLWGVCGGGGSVFLMGGGGVGVVILLLGCGTGGMVLGKLTTCGVFLMVPLVIRVTSECVVLLLVTFLWGGFVGVSLGWGFCLQDGGVWVLWWTVWGWGWGMGGMVVFVGWIRSICWLEVGLGGTVVIFWWGGGWGAGEVFLVGSLFWVVVWGWWV